MTTTRMAAVAGALLCSCAAAPGMRMNEGAAVDRGRAAGKDPQFTIHPITAALVSRLAAERARAAAPTMKDPLADEAKNWQYRVAPHDVLQVTVWDHPELTAPSGQYRSPEENGVLVNSNGAIFFPYVGTIDVAGKTLSEIRDLVTQRLARVVANPQLDVRVAAFRGKKVQITGEVVAPATVPLTDLPLRIQDALALAKGFTPDSDFSRVSLARDSKVYVLNLQALYEQGDLTQNWLLKDGDVVNVPDRSANKVFVMGEVRSQTSKLMVRGRMTLLEALSDPGVPGSGVVNGFDPIASDVSKIYVLRGEYAAPAIFQLDASSADALLLAAQFPLQPRDVVFVSTYGIARFGRVMSQILPTVQALWQTYDIVYRSR